MSDTGILKSSGADCEYIHARLREYNREYYGEVTDYGFHIQKNGRIVAGIVAYGTFDTLEVEFLFVEEDCRQEGLGRKLLTHAENAARGAGLKRVLLNTYSYQAPGFYEKLGYTELFRIEPCFGPHSQHFFMKAL